MRVIIPPPGNETIGMLKTTSLVLALPFTLDLQYATSAIANCTYAPIPLLVVAASAPAAAVPRLTKLAALLLAPESKAFVE